MVTIPSPGGHAATIGPRLASGDDTFIWDPGDGSDTVEGEAGADTLVLLTAPMPAKAFSLGHMAAGPRYSVTSAA